MAPVLVGGSWVPAATLACGLVPPSLVLLLLLCSFCHRENRSFSTQGRKTSSGLVQGVKLARLSSRDGRVALQGGTPSPSEHQQQVDGSTELGNPELHVPGLTPHSQAPSGPIPKTPEFLQHRQLPVLPGYTRTPTANPAPAGEGPIYESIRYKSGTQKNSWGTRTTLGDAPSLPAGDTPSLPTGDTPPLPIGNTPSLPIGDTPSLTVGDTPSLTVGDTPSLTVGNTPSLPAGDNPSLPAGNTPSLPIGNTPSLPVWNTPSLPAGNTSSLPVRDTPSLPIGNIPSLPIGNTPSLPVGNTPSLPIGDTPSLPIGNTQSLPAGNTPSLPAGDKLSIPMPEDRVPEEMSQEEPGREGNLSPVYAQVCKPPRVLQPWHPISTPEPQEEEEEETPPPLPEKCFDVA